MKTKVTFKDSFDNGQMSVEITGSGNIRLGMGEDAEKRKELTEWLKGIGYYVCSCCLFDGCNTLHCRGIDRLKIAYEVHGICDYDEETRYSIDQFKAENVAKGYPAIDCGENIELFKALAAMNDENDREQWFIAEEAKAWVNQGLYATHWELRKMLAGASGRYPRP